MRIRSYVAIGLVLGLCILAGCGTQSFSDTVEQNLQISQSSQSSETSVSEDISDGASGEQGSPTSVEAQPEGGTAQDRITVPGAFNFTLSIAGVRIDSADINTLAAAIGLAEPLEGEVMFTGNVDDGVVLNQYGARDAIYSCLIQSTAPSKFWPTEDFSGIAQGDTLTAALEKAGFTPEQSEQILPAEKITLAPSEQGGYFVEEVLAAGYSMPQGLLCDLYVQSDIGNDLVFRFHFVGSEGSAPDDMTLEWVEIINQSQMA